MKNELVINIEDRERLSDIGKALSSIIRLDILYYLSQQPAIISDVAAHFDIPLSSAALHIKTLESAGLISVQPIPGSKGAQKLCGILISRIDIDMYRNINTNNSQLLYREDLPIGSYFDCDVSAPCGIVSETHDLGAEDSFSGFYSPDRFKAQLIWLSTGYLEYRFSNATLKSHLATKVQITLEICSEALGYNNNWKSDVSIWLNDTEIGIIKCPGDYGGRRGKLNPYWWADSSTQYGDLRKIWVTNDGCYIDEVKISDQTINSLQLNKNNYITMRIGVKPTAQYVGGFNLFGEKFGDYPQNIVMEVFNELD